MSFFFNAPKQCSIFSMQPCMMRPMSTFFKEMDQESRFKLGWERQKMPEYEKIMNKWKKPYEKK